MREADWQATVEATLKLQGWRLYHTRDSRGSVGGFPDIIAIRGSRLLAIELKNETRKATSQQVEWLEAFAGVESVESYLWRPDDWPDVQRLSLK